jgi:tetratricopeptide (TPR) repeat protein
MRSQFRILIFIFLLEVPCALWATVGVEFRVMGMSLYRAGKYQKAVIYFKSAIQANPKDWKAYEDLGSAYERLNDPADALAAYRQALRLNSGDSNLQTYVQKLSKSAGGVPACPTAVPAAAPTPVSGKPTSSN